MRARPLEVLENPVTKTIRLSMLQVWIVDQVKAMKRAEIHGVILFMFIAASLASFSHHSLFSRTNFRLVHVTYVFHKFSIHEIMIMFVYDSSSLSQDVWIPSPFDTLYIRRHRVRYSIPKKHVFVEGF